MIYKMTYSESVDTDIEITVDNANIMGIRVKFTHFKDGLNNVEKYYDCVITFQPDTKYDKIISLYLIKDARIVIDERFNDPFYYETAVSDSVDKICWFTLPKNFNDSNGLNALEIYTKGGVQ